MEKILWIDACVRPESRTRKLAQAVLTKLNGQITTLRLSEEDIRPLDDTALEERDRALEQNACDSPVLRYARQFAQADTIVIAAPYWDLSFPSLLKVYIEAVNIIGVVFYYNDSGEPVSLCRAKRLIYVTTAGGKIFADLGYDYIRTLAEAFYQIPHIRCFRAEGLDLIDADPAKLLQEATETVFRELGQEE